MEQKYIPGQVVWELTLKCNLNCIHCGSNAGKSRSNELTNSEGMTLIEDLHSIGSQEVCFMGGEPFLRKDWFELGKKVRDTGMELLFISNGFNVNNNIISKLVKLQPHAVGVSLDGGTAKTHDYIRGRKGSFDKVKEYIYLAKKANLPVSVVTTVSKINFSELPLIRDYLLKQDHVAWQIQMAAPEGRFSVDYALSKEEYYAVGLFIANLRNTYSSEELPVIGAHCFGYYSNKIPSLGLYSNWIGCQAGITILSIRSNGDVTGCLSQQNYYNEGNIREKSIIEIWNDPNAFAYNRKFTADMLGENCKTCRYGAMCKGGCLGNSLTFTGKPYNDPYCFYKIEQELDR
jgi:radical SAM protein with 4Fe4S-binding SPASM domain